eukprot:4412485-Pyramimonas_sp.AAC.1
MAYQNNTRARGHNCDAPHSSARRSSALARPLRACTIGHYLKARRNRDAPLVRILYATQHDRYATWFLGGFQQF